jgi:predicted metal-binding protein
MADRITVCAGCREGAGAALAERLRAGLPEVEVRLAECLNACGAPLALAVTGDGKASYLFGGVEPDAQAEEVAAFMGLYAVAPAGEVADARACGRLRLCLRGRIPA